MSLKNIRASIAADTGYHPDSSVEDKQYLDAQINNVVENLYNAQDLPNSLFEIITFYDQDAKLVSLPSYVGHIRGARYYDSPYGITLRDIRPRYATDSYTIQLADFREVGVSSLAIQPDEWSILTFSLPEGEVAEKDIVIAIVGETSVASRIEEQVTIPEGSRSVSSINNWKEAPSVIRKNDTNNHDITVTDINGEELAIIPNHMLASTYSIWQFRDDNLLGQISTNSIEVLYKEKLRPLVNDYDEFLLSKYDDIIAWQFLELYYSKQEGKKELADQARDQWTVGLVDVNRNNARGKKAEEQFVPNKFYGLFKRTSFRRYPHS